MVDGVDPFDPWSSGVLKPDVHDRLVASIDQVAHRAGLGDRYKHLIWAPTDPVVSDGELEWAKAVAVLRQTQSVWTQDKLGIAYPSSVPDVMGRMRYLTARLIRNMVDARLLTLSEIIAERRGVGVVEGSAILCPDFLVPEVFKTLSDWDKREMVSFLKDRIKDGAPTMLYCGMDLGVLKTSYPSMYADLASSFLLSGSQKSH